ncbi:MAG: gas vesicle protein GvpG [Pseudomonadota bacterium]
MLLRLLALPIRAPFDATLWLAKQIEDHALREYTDPAVVKRTLDQLDEAVEAGTISEEEYDRLEDVLLERLRIGQRHREQQS